MLDSDTDSPSDPSKNRTCDLRFRKAIPTDGGVTRSSQNGAESRELERSCPRKAHDGEAHEIGLQRAPYRAPRVLSRLATTLPAVADQVSAPAAAHEFKEQVLAALTDLRATGDLEKFVDDLEQALERSRGAR